MEQQTENPNKFIKSGHRELQVIEGFLINPFTKNISKLFLPAMHNEKIREERLAMMQSFVAGYIERISWDYSIDPEQCSHWTLYNDLYANEEGLFQGWNKGFIVKNLWTHQPILGCAIVFGSDHRNGKLLSATVDRLTLENAIQWVTVDPESLI